MGGPGTELKSLLAKVRIVSTESCHCDKYAMLMDQRGCDWCLRNVEFLTDVLEESAEARGLFFTRFVGRRLVKLAVFAARKKERKTCVGATE